MKTLNKISLYEACILGLVSAASCNDSKYDYDHLFPEEYHKIVYINDEADEPFTIYDADEPHVDTITVFKGGSDPMLEADADLIPCTTEELDSLGKDYTILPANCYKVESPIHFDPNIRYKKVGITYDLEAVKSFLASYSGSKSVALALKLTSSNCNTNQEKQWFLRRITVEQPKVSFVTSNDDATISVPFTASETTINTQFSITNKWNFDVTLSTEDGEKDVEAYNAAHGTNYKLMPADSYSFTTTDLKYTQGTSSVSTTFRYSADNLSILNVYMLPVRVKSSTMLGISLPDKPLYIIIDPKVSLTYDMLSSPCTEPTEGSLLNLIDNNPSTFWHSVWSIRYYNDMYSHYFDVHLSTSLKKQMRFDYYARDYWPVLPLEITIYVSRDGKSWTKLVALEKEKDKLADVGGQWTSSVYDLPIETNYIRLSIVKSNQGYCGRTGSTAAVAICGFDLWGK